MRDVLQQALAAMRRAFDEYSNAHSGITSGSPWDQMRHAIRAAESALAESEQEPVAWRLWPESGDAKHWHYIERLDGNDTSGYTVQPLYAEPVARRQLTEEEIWSIHDCYLSPIEFAREIEKGPRDQQ